MSIGSKALGKMVDRYVGVSIALIATAIVVVGIIYEPKKIGIDISDVFFEGCVTLLALGWIIIINQTTERRKIHIPLAAGFALLFGAFLKDVVDEFVDFGVAYDLVEKIGSIAGMLLVSIGLVNWVRSFRHSQRDLETLVDQRTAELVEANELLRDALASKEVLLKEIHHRVKNNLQVIESLLRLQANAAEQFEVKTALGNVRRRVRAIAIVHELLYQRENPGEIQMSNYLEILVGNISTSLEQRNEGIDISLQSDSIGLDMERAVLCGMLVNELVANAALHGFPDGTAGRIGIELRRLGGKIDLTVTDNGIGMQNTEQPGAAVSLGLKLVHAWANQLQADLAVSREGGTEFKISFDGPELSDAEIAVH